MAELLTLPPTPEAITAMVAIPKMSISPTILATQQGPDGGLGPESAEAILILQATFSQADGAEKFWAAAVPLMELLASAPGFIRRYSFPDGPNITLIACGERPPTPRRSPSRQSIGLRCGTCTRSVGSTAISPPCGRWPPTTVESSSAISATRSPLRPRRRAAVVGWSSWTSTGRRLDGYVALTIP